MLLSEEQRMARDTAREFARREIAPHAAEWDRTATFPPEAITTLGRLGFMGVTVPPEWDGAGLDYVAYALALEEVAAGDGAVSTVMSGHNSVGCMPILEYGTVAQKEKYLWPLARGEMLCAFCLTEPQGGSDASALRTRATRYGGGLGAERHQAVHHQREHGGHRARPRGVGSGRGQARDQRVHHRNRQPRLQGCARREEDGPERLGHVRSTIQLD